MAYMFGFRFQLTVVVFLNIRQRRKQTKARASLVPEPSSLRDFSTRLSVKSNSLGNSDEEHPVGLSDRESSSRGTVVTPRTNLPDALKKTTFRPPTLLRTSPNLVAAAGREASNHDLPGKYRNFNDLWVRLENGGHSYIR